MMQVSNEQASTKALSREQKIAQEFLEVISPRHINLTQLAKTMKVTRPAFYLWRQIAMGKHEVEVNQYYADRFLDVIKVVKSGGYNGN